MGGLTVLSEHDVESLLLPLTVDELERFQQDLAEALHDYSTGTQEQASCAANQPERIVLCGRERAQLFIPARTASVTGVKLLSLPPSVPPPTDQDPTKDGSLAQALDNPQHSERSEQADLSPTASINASTAASSTGASSHGSASTGSSSKSKSGTSKSGSSNNATASLPPLSSPPSLAPSTTSSTTNSIDSSNSAASSSSRHTSISFADSVQGDRKGPVTMPVRTQSSSSIASKNGGNGTSGGDNTGAQSSTDEVRESAGAPRGTLTLQDPTGHAVALLSATTLTAFRTALASTLLLTKRQRVHTLVVFGAGPQAAWHIRLALLLRGKDIHHVRIINRTFAGAEPLLKEIYTSPAWAHLRTANSKLDFSVLSQEYGEYNRVLKEQVRDADVIFACTPSAEPLFPASYLTNREGRRKGRFIAGVGSYRAHMAELPPEIFQLAVEPTKPRSKSGPTRSHHSTHSSHHGHGSGKRHHSLKSPFYSRSDSHAHDSDSDSGSGSEDEEHRGEHGSITSSNSHSTSNSSGSGSGSGSSKSHFHWSLHDNGSDQRSGVVLVDGLDACLRYAGEIVRAELRADQLVELGELIMVKRAFHREIALGGPGVGGEGLVRWLKEGNVVYKSVGLGLMDVSVGENLVRLATDKGVGTVVEGF